MAAAFGRILRQRVGQVAPLVAKWNRNSLARASCDLKKISQSRQFATSWFSSAQYLDVTQKDGVAQLLMKRDPVNSLSLELLEELCLALEDLENDRDCRGVIIGSAIPDTFSYGLDISEYYKQGKERLEVFRRRYQEMWIRLYGSRLVCGAAITGHAPGGGCLIALSCDYRIMAPDYLIGYNEIKGGLVAPSWFVDTMTNVVGHGFTERSVQVGELLEAEHALKAGLVDKVVPTELVMDEAKKEMKKWLNIPVEKVRAKAKLMMRRDAIQKLQNTRHEDIRDFVARVTKESTQNALAGIVEKRESAGKKSMWGEDA